MRRLRRIILADAVLLLLGGLFAVQQLGYWQAVGECREAALSERQADLYCERNPWLMIDLWKHSK